MNAPGQELVTVVFSLQFVAFGWRINREISLDDQGRRTWLLIGDYLNLVSMVAVLALCIIHPLATRQFSSTARACLAFAFVLAVFYPVTLAGHYRLFSQHGRQRYKDQGRDVPRVTDQEAALLLVSVVGAAFAAYFVASRS
jgi:hypothetical protein